MKKNEFRVLFDCHTFDTGWQGTTTFLAGIINALPEAMRNTSPHVDLRIICAAHNYHSVREKINVEFEFEQVDLGFIRRNTFSIPRALKRTGADLVVSQYVRPFFSPCVTLSVIHDTLFIDYPESFDWSYRIVRRVLFRWAARNSDKVSTVSRYSAERIATHFGINDDEIMVTTNAISPEFATAPAARAPTTATTRLRLLSVSRLEKRKRHEWCMHALQALTEDGFDAELIIVGGGSGAYPDELRSLARDMQTSHGMHITFKSNLSFRELVEEYSASNVFLFPSEAEGFGIPVIEAAAVGLPCVCSNGGALSELEDSISGVQFVNTEMQSFVNGVVNVAKRIDHYSEQASRKRCEVINYYTWTQVAQSYAKYFAEIEKERY